MEQRRIEQGIRLKKLMKALNLNQSSFAKSLGMTQPNINRMVSGGNNISVEALNRITDTYKNVNLHWLLTGDGAMFLEELQEKNAQVNEDSIPYNRKERLEERVKELEERVKRLEKK